MHLLFKQNFFYFFPLSFFPISGGQLSILEETVDWEFTAEAAQESFVVWVACVKSVFLFFLHLLVFSSSIFWRILVASAMTLETAS